VMGMFSIKRVDRLVALSVLGSLLTVWLVLTGFDAVTQFLRQLGNVGKHGYTVTDATVYVLVTFPRRAYEMFGNATLIGSLLGLGQLAASGELTALRAAGLSKVRICASVVLALLLLTAAVTLVGETLGPYGERKAQALQLAAKSRDITLAKGGGLWARDAGAVINARHARTHQTGLGSEVELEDVRVFDFEPDGRLSALSHATRATHTNEVWKLFDVRRTEFAKDRATSTKLPEMEWKSGLDPSVLALSIVKPQYMAARDLARNIDYLERNAQDAGPFREVYWERIFYPFNVLVLAFCAVPFAFGALRSGGLSKRLFIGMVLAISFYFLQNAIVKTGIVYGYHPAFANLIPPTLLVLAAFGYFKRYD
jgi:lipopolysaccharide export system permease protein